jgi:uncharacterized membrane protein YqhA
MQGQPDSGQPVGGQPDGSRPGSSQPDRGAPGPRPDRTAAALARAEQALAASLWLAVIPVVVLILAALGAFAYGTAVFVDAVGSIVRHPFPVGHQIGLFLLDIDLFLIGATLLISAVGFYELFVRDIPADGRARMPAWLAMRDLNDLKGRVIAMIVMVLAVSFVELAVDEGNGGQILDIGGGIAAVIIALTAFLRLTGHGSDRT